MYACVKFKLAILNLATFKKLPNCQLETSPKFSHHTVYKYMYCYLRLVEWMALNHHHLCGQGSNHPLPVRAMEYCLCQERRRPRLPTGGEYCYSLWPLQCTIYQVCVQVLQCSHPLIVYNHTTLSVAFCFTHVKPEHLKIAFSYTQFSQSTTLLPYGPTSYA